MDEAFVAVSAGEVRGLIASLWLGAAGTVETIGNIRLAPHQRLAVSRIEAAFAEFGGALLCDAVGSGKTYVGAAIASVGKGALIIAPAGLRSMWQEALEEAHTYARFISVESLSRSEFTTDDVDTIVVDEAHHFRNASTIRHSHLANLISGRKVLLMTATPIHNSRRDLETLLSLFLGKRAAHLSDAEIATIVVRRDRTQILITVPMPEVRPTEWLPVGDDAVISQAIMALPPSLPPRESGRADDLVAHGLTRQWASSEAALFAALRRRLARATALESSLEGGDYPSASELRSWVNAEDSIQLGFAGLLSSAESESTKDLLITVRFHAAALRDLLLLLKSRPTLDRARADQLRLIRSRHPEARIVAFSAYEATLTSLFETLAGSDRVALLTSRGGRVAGGEISRTEIIEQFSPTGRIARASDRINFLLTTDLLSEGVNLQKAEIVIHLDLPWTPARTDQRIGRLARIGSRHSRVSVYGLDPPPSAERILRTSLLLGEKRRVEVIARSPAESHEQIRAVLSGWWRKESDSQAGTTKTLVAAIASTEPGFIGVIERNGKPILIGSDGSSISESPNDLERICCSARGRGLPVDTLAANGVLAQITDWIMSREASESAGLGSSSFLRSRRRILSRIDAITARMPPQARITRSALIDGARRSAAGMHNAAEEKKLERILTNAPESVGSEWLKEIRALSGKQSGANDKSSRIRAVLLLVRASPAPSS